MTRRGGVSQTKRPYRGSRPKGAGKNYARVKTGEYRGARKSFQSIDTQFFKRRMIRVLGKRDPGCQGKVGGGGRVK